MGNGRNDKRGEYQWSGYLELFEKLKKSDLKIQVAICFHEVSEGDFTVSLPSWVLNVGEENPHIFFTDKQKLNSKECLSWGIDDERVLDSRTALEVYSDFMKSFRSTFKKFFKDKTVTVIEVGLGPNGEPRYPSSCSKRGWKYPGVGAFQCYDNYMVENLKKNAFEDHKGQSHAAELTAAFFNSRDHDGYAPFLRMLKANKAGLNVAVNRSYKSDPEQPNENPDEWLEEIKAGVVDAGRHPDFLDEDPVPLSSWNAVPFTDIASYREVLRQAEVEKQKTTYQAFTYHGLGPLMEAPEEFAEFVRIMHDAGDT